MATATRSQTTIPNGDNTSTSTSTSTSIPAPKPVSVLFVCLGNICRSPMAEGVFRSVTHYSTASQHPLISRIDSCGTGAYHAGSQPDSRTLSVLAEKAGITNYKHKARRVRVPADFEEFDFVLAMDGENLEDLRGMVRRVGRKGGWSEGERDKVMGKVRLFGEFGGRDVEEEVGDPYYGGRDGFEVAYEQVERFGKGLLRFLEEEAGKVE